jgi:hypothetical protein
MAPRRQPSPVAEICPPVFPPARDLLVESPQWFAVVVTIADTSVATDRVLAKNNTADSLVSRS